MEIRNIIEVLETYDGRYKRNEVDEALANREEITPHLISILEKVLQDPEKHAELDGDYFGHIYAFMLLGHFGETQAHDIIVKLFSLPNDLSSDLFEDCITEDLPIMLLRTCGGDLSKIKELALNKNAYDYCRGSALYALTYSLVEGYISREEILSFFQKLLLEEESPESAFHDVLACCICDIYPEELMEAVEKAYNEDKICPGHISYEDFTKTITLGKEKCLNTLKENVLKEQTESIHDRMSWWVCFAQPQKISKISTKPSKNKQKKNKGKKKQSKASKKANRKKK